jgi:hypothetical protein
VPDGALLGESAWICKIYNMDLMSSVLKRCCLRPLSQTCFGDWALACFQHLQPLFFCGWCRAPCRTYGAAEEPGKAL